MNPFHPGDPSTWPMALTVENIAAIYQRQVGGVKRQCNDREFVPAPYQYRPLRWKKVDVLRHLGEGAAAPRMVRRSA